ncbi:hypothetical protein Ddye_002241 [Dipteronia dyeriana]|uniref:PB1 domain-containing protein n=1 Tax=Dipteronia dyeriana TaxID=168575 RepID=A0AAD9XQI7_9ROSI|nr:hypothetical protein Ddye_002241 [Dipteronia dyeriana]
MVMQVESENLKFLCSYGGKIHLRSTDGNLRYVGGLTRVFSVERSVSYTGSFCAFIDSVCILFFVYLDELILIFYLLTELMVKLGEFCGYSVTLRCQLPNGDLETLISIKSDEDLANLIEEYDRAASGSKIRAILSPPASLKQISPPPSVDFSANKPTFGVVGYHRSGSQPSSPPSFVYPDPVPPTTIQSFRAHRNSSSPPSSPPYGYFVSGKACHYPPHRHVQGNPMSLYSGHHHLNHKNY